MTIIVFVAAAAAAVAVAIFLNVSVIYVDPRNKSLKFGPNLVSTRLPPTHLSDDMISLQSLCERHKEYSVVIP